MTRVIDIFRSANLLLKQHGYDANFHAAQRIDELSAVGDLDGAATWRRILKAIETLTLPARAGDLMQ